jgi:hypothetical protein
MGRERTQQAPDLFSTASPGGTTSPTIKQVSPAQKQRHILPKNLPNAVKHLNDQELDLLIAACLEEAKRRGKLQLPRISKSHHERQVEASTVSLTRGQLNAVRAALKAGIKPSLIARQFGISQSDVRKVLASDADPLSTK